MKILIFGAGAIGSVFGGFLSAHHDVTLLGRKPHLDAIRKTGLRISGIWGNHCFKSFHLVTDWKKLAKARPEFDLILVTVKSYDTPQAARAIRSLICPATLVVSLQNGIGNIEALQRDLPKKQIIAGRIIFGVEALGPGRVKVTVIADPAGIGETMTRRITPRARRTARLFDQAGIPAVPCRDVRALLWMKVIYNAALNPLASLMECHYGKLTESLATRLLMDQVIDEIYQVTGAAGIRMPIAHAAEYKKIFYSKLVARTYLHHPSMLQDLTRGKRTEIDAITGAVIRLAEEQKIYTPINKRLWEMVRLKERAYA